MPPFEQPDASRRLRTAPRERRQIAPPPRSMPVCRRGVRPDRVRPDLSVPRIARRRRHSPPWRDPTPSRRGDLSRLLRGRPAWRIPDRHHLDDDLRRGLRLHPRARGRDDRGHRRAILRGRDPGLASPSSPPGSRHGLGRPGAAREQSSLVYDRRLTGRGGVRIPGPR
jgi:hypothetical protein